MLVDQHDLLKGLPDSQAEAALALGRRFVLSSGAELFNLGTPADELYLIDRGRIRLTLPMRVMNRDEDVLVEERGPGQTVGWSALIPPYKFTLRATAPLETEVVALSRKALKEFFAQHPDLGYAVVLNLATVIGQRLQVYQAMWIREMQRLVEMRCH